MDQNQIDNMDEIDDKILDIYDRIETSLNNLRIEIRNLTNELIRAKKSNRNIKNNDTKILPPWDKNNLKKKCTICDKDFNIFYRKHHCRACGNIVCHTCSKHKYPVPKFAYYKPVRVCMGCFMQQNL